MSDVRFLDKVRVGEDSGCWSWTGCRLSGGYGLFWNSAIKKVVLAHRWAYERWRDPIPEGLVIDHLCRNRACQNPWHMEPVTQRENTLRGENRVSWQMSTDTCLRGHPLIQGPRQRRCVPCTKERSHLNYLRQKAEGRPYRQPRARVA